MTDTFRIVWSEAALQDVENILEYIALRDSITAASNVYDKLLIKIETLAAHPERCRVVPELKSTGIDDFQELIIRPYRICFRIHRRDIVLVSVLDGRRDLEQVLIQRALQR